MLCRETAYSARKRWGLSSSNSPSTCVNRARWWRERKTGNSKCTLPLSAEDSIVNCLDKNNHTLNFNYTNNNRNLLGEVIVIITVVAFRDKSCPTMYIVYIVIHGLYLKTTIAILILEIFEMRHQTCCLLYNTFIRRHQALKMVNMKWNMNVKSVLWLVVGSVLGTAGSWQKYRN